MTRSAGVMAFIGQRHAYVRQYRVFPPALTPAPTAANVVFSQLIVKHLELIKRHDRCDAGAKSSLPL